ncbi:MAG: glypican [Cyanobacteriota bacterium]|nr:glypican [Cyanobacteriota bacterium]
MIRSLSIPSLPASLLLVSASLGIIVLGGLVALTVVPLVFVLGGVFLWLVSTFLIAIAGIEVLAACERWIEGHPRFQR